MSAGRIEPAARSAAAARRLLVTGVAAAIAAACSRTPSPSIVVDRSVSPPVVEVHGLPPEDITALQTGRLRSDGWQAILRVNAQGDVVPVAGRYSAADGIVRFRPLHEFEGWRTYTVRLDATKIPGADPSETWRAKPVSHVVAISRRSRGRSTSVKAVYPSGARLPEDTLRLHIEFTAPMGRASALEHVRLIDEQGHHVVDPFLPVDPEFWAPDRTRVTLSFDPGRVKRGITPHRDLGPALVPGRRYALVVGERWMDARGQLLKAPYRHEFTVSPAVDKPLDPAEWTIAAPKAGTRDPLAVTFPWALDHVLLQRALSVRLAGVAVGGEDEIGEQETRWTFTPHDPWGAAQYVLSILPLLEDPAGNRLAVPTEGIPFEVR